MIKEYLADCCGKMQSARRGEQEDCKHRNLSAMTSPDDIHIVYRSSKRVTAKQLDRLESLFGAELPRGYRAFLTQFGHGWINGWLQFYCPDATLIKYQRESMLQDFDDESQGDIDYDGAQLTRADMKPASRSAS